MVFLNLNFIPNNMWYEYFSFFFDTTYMVFFLKKEIFFLIWYEKFIYQIDSSYGNTATLIDLKDLRCLVKK